MLFAEPTVLHSPNKDGRHWLTVADVPSMQLLPVAPNHCRVGHFLAKIIAAKLARLAEEPLELVVTRADVMAVDSLAAFPEIEGEAGDVRVVLAYLPGPEGEPDSGEEGLFLTPQPPANWSSSYDAWITFAGRALGMDAPEAVVDAACYEQEFAAASIAFQGTLPKLRQRYLAGLGSVNLGLKVGLATRFGGTEFVWVRPVDWGDAANVTCVLESQPRNCKGYVYGQEIVLAPSRFLDYLMGSQTHGIIERGNTHRIAENYGLIV